MHRNNTKPWLLLYVLVLGVGLAITSLTSCTVTQSAVKPTEASFDGNDQNSGIIGVTTQAGFAYECSPGFYLRWVDMIKEYGDSKYADGRFVFDPPIDPTAGVTRSVQGTYLFSKESMSYFIRLAALQRRAQSAK